MAKINLGKTIETISWSDEPGAKEYIIDFSDESLKETWASLKKMADEIDGYMKSEREDPQTVAEAIKRFVVTLLGEEAYEDALAYVDVRGQGAEHCNMMMTGLVQGLADILAKHMGVKRDQALKKYLSKDADLELV